MFELLGKLTTLGKEKRCLAIFILIFLCSSFFIRTSSLEAYQKGLWTSHDFVRGQPTNDIVLKNGGKSIGLVEWRRFWIGVPTKAVTIDRNGRTLQARVEILPLLINLVFALFISIAGSISYIAIRHAVRTGFKIQ